MICLNCKLNSVELNSTKLWCRACRAEARERLFEWRRTHPKRLWRGTSYESRELMLREIGFPSYRAYLASDLWRSIRERVFRAKGRKCHLCGKPATSVHHQRYHKNDLLGKRLGYVFPICTDCHEEVEFSRKGKKVDLATARSRFRERERRKTTDLCSLLLNHDATDDSPQPL